MEVVSQFRARGCASGEPVGDDGGVSDGISPNLLKRQSNLRGSLDVPKNADFFDVCFHRDNF